MTNYRTLVLATVVAMALSVTACGKKASPVFPPGSNYPSQYPLAEEKQKPAKPQSSTGSGNEYKGGAVSPQGFPLEYPNRPSY